MQWIAGVLLAAAVFSSSSALALNSQRSVFQLKHTRFTANDGAPTRIVALAQGQNGFLWVGGGDGLYRFDGVAFERIASPKADAEGWRVSALLAAADGAIWVGYGDGHLAIYRDGTLREVPIPAPGVYLMKLLQTPDGAIWVTLGRPRDPVLRYNGRQWEEITGGWGPTPGYLVDSNVAQDGTLWVTTLSELWALRPSSSSFEPVAAVTGHAAISQDPQGAIWISDDRGSRPVGPESALSSQSASYTTPGSRKNFRTLFARDGNLWGANANGIFRVRGAADFGSPSKAGAARVEQYLAVDGLTSNHTGPIIEDREGDIWVGSSRGLDMFHNVPVITEPTLTDLPTFGIFLLGASTGEVYVGTADTVYRVKPGGDPEPLIEHVSETSAICEGPKGTIWIFLKDRFLELRGNAWITHSLPPAGETEIQNCSVDDRGVLWANAQSMGLFRWESSGWVRTEAENAKLESELMTTDRNGHLMLFLRSGKLVRLDDKLQPGSTLFRWNAPDNFLYQGQRNFYMSGTFGLARIDKGAQVLWSSHYPEFRDISAVVETPAGQMWLATKAGVVEVDTPALDHAFADPSFQLHPTILNVADGLPDFIARGNERAGVAAVGGDGRVWVSTNSGAVWIDPRHLLHKSPPPPVVIRALVAAGSRYQDPSQLVLPAGTTSVAIDYSGLGLSIPERVHFRYRLDSIDTDWVDAGKRRQAFYTQLAPGTYRFHLSAANDNGAWNLTGATVSFTIAPSFIQSIWFKLLMAALLVGLTWVGYSLRVQRVTAQLQSRFDVRIAERERIARELHDTLLQGCQGLLLQFQSIANSIPAGEELRTVIDGALNRADVILAEGRARVRELRSAVSTDDLAGSLTDRASAIISGATPCFHLTVLGEQRALNALICDEVLRIFEEAVHNVVKHANARNVDALLTYGREALRLSVHDDGVGMAKLKLTDDDSSDRFGIIGFDERRREYPDCEGFFCSNGPRR